MSDIMTTILEDPLVGALARLGERYDNERAHPADSMALLVEAGLLHRFAPVESGARRLPMPLTVTMRCSTRCAGSVAAT
ncbi:hypothetical protein QP162_13800 [Sphingomonas aurantiaca]|uniref:hypothetical protein n=1 Tax=Sphingomonas aurantiaca TaxID=185949 RepID=UPI002FDFD440